MFKSILLTLLLPTTLALAKSKAPDHWVGTWATASYALDNSTGALGQQDTTFRQTVHISAGGSLFRVELSNEFGTQPLTIGAAHIALAGTSPGEISLLTANALTFSGQATVTIPPGATALSDPAALTAPASADLVISLYLPVQPIPQVTFHNDGLQTNYMAPGNVAGQRSLPGATPNTRYYFLRSVDVQLPADAGAVVAFGDSITDGARSTAGTNNRWPDELARRLQSNKATRAFSVLNAGIGGNRVLHDNTGPNALARFDRDVLAHPGVRFLIILEGINDIGATANPTNPHDPVTAQELIQALSQMIDRAHLHGIKVFPATLTPYMGAGYSSTAGEAIRTAYNNWIRTQKVADGFLDFDAATRDPAHPDSLNPAYDSNDKLHPSDAGYKAMGDAIDLKLFTAK